MDGFPVLRTHLKGFDIIFYFPDFDLLLVSYLAWTGGSRHASLWLVTICILNSDLWTEYRYGVFRERLELFCYCAERRYQFYKMEDFPGCQKCLQHVSLSHFKFGKPTRLNRHTFSMFCKHVRIKCPLEERQAYSFNEANPSSSPPFSFTGAGSTFKAHTNSNVSAHITKGFDRNQPQSLSTKSIKINITSDFNMKVGAGEGG